MKRLKTVFRSPMILLMCITTVAVTVLGIVFKQDIWRILPLYVSVVIAFLQSRVNRFALILGALNSLLYGAVYFSYGLYASMLYALTVSAPLQGISFVRWRKNTYEKTACFHKLSTKQGIFMAGGLVLFWVILYAILSSLGSAYMILDNTATMLGVAATVLMIVPYIEYTYLLNLNNLCVLILYITMLPENPEQVTYLVYTVYALICSVLASVRAWKHFLAQQRAAQA